MAKKHARSIEEMARSLATHVQLLRDHASKAFSGEDAYLGEVAGKLRLLVCRGANRPLLIQIMDRLAIKDVQITLDGPPIKRSGTEPIPGDVITLQHYLKLTAYGIRTPSHGFVTVSKQEFIAMWAQQIGASHEAWELDERLLAVLDSGISLGGVPANVAELRITTDTVLNVAAQVLVHPKFAAVLDS